MRYEVAIIGAGPAGLCAAIYAARKKLRTYICGGGWVGGQATWSADVENYPGFHLLSGGELIQKFQAHLLDYDLKIDRDARVVKCEKTFEDYFVLTLADGTTIEAWSVIIASGKQPRMLDVPGEKEFVGRGITYCATCDGPLFKGKRVAVVGGGNSALDATLTLRRFCPEVVLITVNSEMSGEQVMIDAIKKDKGVIIFTNATVVACGGTSHIENIQFRVQGKHEVIKEPVSGIFVEVGYVAHTEWMGDLVERDTRGEIIIALDNATKTPGLFAAGDVTMVPAKQIVVAAGEGAKALLSAHGYLARKGLLGIQ